MTTSKQQDDSQREGSRTHQRGFASMDPERQREIARQGGRTAHANGNAHQFTPEEARAAGRKGGQTVSKNREHMAAIGRKGGEAANNSRVNQRTSSPPESSRSVGE